MQDSRSLRYNSLFPSKAMDLNKSRQFNPFGFMPEISTEEDILLPDLNRGVVPEPILAILLSEFPSELNTKKQTKHNRNMAKFLVGMFVDHIFAKQNYDLFRGELFTRTKDIIHSWIQSRKGSRNFNISHLQDLFVPATLADQKRCRCNCKVLRKLIKKHGSEYVLRSSRIKCKVSYLLNLKMYATRLLSSVLAGRIQNR